MVIWLIGLSGAGKTTLGQAITDLAREKVSNIVFLDGDIIRRIFANDLGYSLEDRRKNADRICLLCKLLNDQGIHVVCAILSLFHESQEWNRQNIHDYYEIYIEAPLQQLIERDPKGLYKKALAGELKNVAGMDLPFTPPKAPDLVIDNSGDEVDLLAFAPQIAAKLIGEEAK